MSAQPWAPDEELPHVIGKETPPGGEGEATQCRSKRADETRPPRPDSDLPAHTSTGWEKKKKKKKSTCGRDGRRIKTCHTCQFNACIHIGSLLPSKVPFFFSFLSLSVLLEFQSIAAI